MGRETDLEGPRRHSCRSGLSCHWRSGQYHGGGHVCIYGGLVYVYDPFQGKASQTPQTLSSEAGSAGNAERVGSFRDLKMSTVSLFPQFYLL